MPEGDCSNSLARRELLKARRPNIFIKASIYWNIITAPRIFITFPCGPGLVACQTSRILSIPVKAFSFFKMCKEISIVREPAYKSCFPRSCYYYEVSHVVYNLVRFSDRFKMAHNVKIAQRNHLYASRTAWVFQSFPPVGDKFENSWKECVPNW